MLTDMGILSVHNCTRQLLSRLMDNQYKWFIKQLMSPGSAARPVATNGSFALIKQGRKGWHLMLASNCLSVTWDRVRNDALGSILFPWQSLHGYQGLQGARCGVQGGDLGHEHHQWLTFRTTLRYLSWWPCAQCPAGLLLRPNPGASPWSPPHRPRPALRPPVTSPWGGASPPRTPPSASPSSPWPQPYRPP